MYYEHICTVTLLMFGCITRRRVCTRLLHLKNTKRKRFKIAWIRNANYYSMISTKKYVYQRHVFVLKCPKKLNSNSQYFRKEQRYRVMTIDFNKSVNIRTLKSTRIVKNTNVCIHNQKGIRKRRRKRKDDRVVICSFVRIGKLW